MAKVIDRRAARTRRSLHRALIALILRQGYDATTIQEIIDEADVGRSTFYAHFTGKEDLLRTGFDQLRNELSAARRQASSAAEASPDQPLAFSRAMFEHACAYKDVYRALVGGRGGMVAVNEIRRVLAAVVKDELLAHDAGVPRELAVQFVVGAFMATLTWLLERRPKLTPAEVDVMFRRLVIGGIGQTK